MKTILFATVLVAFYACKSGNDMEQPKKDGEKTQFVPQYAPGPQALVYKTKGDYHKLVPVLLSDDKSEIVSYPHPNDLNTDAGFPLPTLLNKGYFLDNRGIGKNVAFLNLTYKEYSKLETLPTLTELYSYILDKNPLTELCDCGNKKAFTNIEKQLNQLIDEKELRAICKVVK